MSRRIRVGQVRTCPAQGCLRHWRNHISFSAWSDKSACFQKSSLSRESEKCGSKVSRSTGQSRDCARSRYAPIRGSVSLEITKERNTLRLSSFRHRTPAITSSQVSVPVVALCSSVVAALRDTEIGSGRYARSSACRCRMSEPLVIRLVDTPFSLRVRSTSPKCSDRSGSPNPATQALLMVGHFSRISFTISPVTSGTSSILWCWRRHQEHL